MKIGTFAGAALAVAISTSMASAAPVQLAWVTTVLGTLGSAIPTTVGEAFTTTITVDNGGAGVLSQSWGETDFLSYRIEGASGWWAEITSVSDWSGAFTTDGAGGVTAAATFEQGSNVSMMMSWSGADNAQFFNNGNNEVFYTQGGNSIYAANVSGNIVGSNWTATSVAAPVPLPGALPLMLAAAGALFAIRRRRTTTA
jgi:MYXO-CTERM domain-containing protein